MAIAEALEESGGVKDASMALKIWNLAVHVGRKYFQIHHITDEMLGDMFQTINNKINAPKY